MDIQRITPNVVYLFSDGHAYYAAARAKFPGGIDDVWGYGWAIEPDPHFQKNPKALQIKRAKRSARTRVENLLNALALYGKDTVDMEGNVDWERFQLLERKTALQGTKGKIIVPLEILKPVRKFKAQDISMDEAIRLGLFSL